MLTRFARQINRHVLSRAIQSAAPRWCRVRCLSSSSVGSSGAPDAKPDLDATDFELDETSEEDKRKQFEELAKSLNMNMDDLSKMENEYKGNAAEVDVEPMLKEVKTKGAPQTMAFQTETRQILDIMAKSLYTDKEVFLRELISNASDALEKLRYLQVTQPNDVTSAHPLEIHVQGLPKTNEIIIRDYGIGMTSEELISHLGTIARSGSKAFVNQLSSENKAGDTNNIIGQFGVGFYSAFMVADKIEVVSQSSKSGDLKAHRWCSDGSGVYELVEVEPSSAPGTIIKLHMKQEAKEFTQPHVLEGILKKYSNFVTHPIFLNGNRINTIDALWLKAKESVTEEQHEAFYRFIANAHDTPFYKTHFNMDAPLAINALFYFPSTQMEKYGLGRTEPGTNVYCRKVLIQHKSKSILPEWLRFVKGAVDSEDIPLNISRENMQDSRLIGKMNLILTKKIIKFLADQAQADPTRYNYWFGEFGSFIKEGVITDQRVKREIVPLLRYETSLEKSETRYDPHAPKDATPKTGPVLSTLEDYISRMPPSQKHIYYLYAPSREFALSSPYYEQFKKKGIEVLFVYNNIDDFVLTSIETYKARVVKSIQQNTKDTEEEKSEETPTVTPTVVDLMTWLSTTLSDRVSSVKPSTRLVSTPAIIVDHESAAVRRLMNQIDAGGRALPKQKMEINPSHPIIVNLAQLRNSNPSLAKLVAEQLFDNALIAADLMDNPRTMLNRLNTILENAVNAQATAANSKPEEVSSEPAEPVKASGQTLEAEVIKS